MTWGAVAVAGATLVGGVMSSRAAKSAANTQADAAQYSANIQKQMFDKQVELQEPWRQAGITALNKLTPLATSYTPFSANAMQNEPGYQFRLGEGLKALDRQAAARGGLISGGALKAAQRYGQDFASNEYQNAFNRYQAERAAQLNPLQSLAGVGQTSANALSNAAGAYGNNASEAAAAAANARASGYVGSANALGGALSGGISQGMNYYQNQSLLNRLSGGSNTSSGSGYGISDSTWMPSGSSGYGVPDSTWMPNG